MEYYGIFDPQELPHMPAEAVTLSWEQFCPLADIWQCLRICLIVRVVGGRGAASVEWIKPREDAVHPVTHRTVLTRHYLVQNVCRDSAMQPGTFYQSRIQQNSVNYKMTANTFGDLDENLTIYNCKFEGGCNGNLKGICKLVEGKNAKEVSEILKGNTCGPRPTSCPDQLSKALALAINE